MKSLMKSYMISLMIALIYASAPASFKPLPRHHLSLCPAIIYASARSSFKPEKLKKSLLFCYWEYVIFSVYIIIQNPLVNHHIVV